MSIDRFRKGVLVTLAAVMFTAVVGTWFDTTVRANGEVCDHIACDQGCGTTCECDGPGCKYKA